MGDKIAIRLVTVVTAGVAVAALTWWLRQAPCARVVDRSAVPEDLGQGLAAAPATDIAGTFAAYDGTPSETLKATWPRFRGAGFDNINTEGTALAEQWPEAGPPLLWEVALGEGHAGPAVRNGRVYVLDYDEDEKADALRCFSLDDGREIWRRWYSVRTKRNHGISRTVPAVTDRFVVTVGPKCHVMCVDADSGAFRWGVDLVREHGAEVPLWYTGQCPLIDDGVAVIAPGGTELMLGLDCESGEARWRTPNPGAWRMSHSSVMPMTIGGRKMYVYCAAGGVAGVAADGPDRGAVLWRSTEWNQSVMAPSPVYLGDGRVLLTAGYGGGSMLIRVLSGAEGFSVQVVSRWDKSVFACEQQTPIFDQGHLYTVMPNDAGALRRQLVCFHPSGELVWASGPDRRYGLGPYLLTGDKLLVLSDDGELTLARVSPSAFRELDKAKLLSGRDAWGPMALVGRRLLLRDDRRMICVDVGAP